MKNNKLKEFVPHSWNSVVIFCLICFMLAACNKEPVSAGKNISSARFPDVTVIRNVLYGSNNTWVGEKTNLLMDIYQPPSGKPGVKYPLYVWMHGGAWLNGSKNANPVSPTGTYLFGMASAGYVTASLDYRLGWQSTGTDCNLQDSVTAKDAVYRSIQDQKAAIRYLVANADKFNIDTNFIFIGGSSAGAGTSLYSAFFTQQIFDNSSPRLRRKLGALDDADNNLTNNYHISGVVNQWGAIEDTSIIVKGYNAVPVLSFAGMKDAEVPWNYGHWRFCDNQQFVYGSESIYKRISHLGLTSMCFIKKDGVHVTFSPDFWIEKTTTFFDAVISQNKRDEIEFL